MIGVLNIGIGNIRSVLNAVVETGFEAEVVDSHAALGALSHFIIPGVGQFATAMRNLRDKGLRDAIVDFAGSGRPVLGICLGMHILADLGAEGGESNGLGLIPGCVDRLLVNNNLRLPHVGWNTVTKTRDHPILGGLKPDRDFYFVHSHGFACEDPNDIMAVTDYGEEFPCIVGRDNVVGFQFHPEKSQVNGLQLIETFCGWDGAC